MTLLVCSNPKLEPLVSGYLKDFNVDSINYVFESLDSKRSKDHPYKLVFGLGNTKIIYDHNLDLKTISMFNKDTNILVKIIESEESKTYIRKEADEIFRTDLTQNEENILNINTTITNDKKIVFKLKLK